MPLIPHIQKRDKLPNSSDIYNLIPNIYSSISLIKLMGLRQKQAEIIDKFEDKPLLQCSKIRVDSIEDAGEDYVYTFNVNQNHNYLAGNGFVLNKNCLQHDLRQFIRYGLKVDGTGDHTSVAGAPQHIETLMNHSGEIMLAAQQNMSGGQSMTLWNIFVAPFAKGLPYEKIKQAVEMMVFNLNMAYAARGGQVPFTSIGLEFTVPDFIKNEPAWGPGGKQVGVYGDYEKEVRLLQRAFTETLLKGDSEGKPHLFPNTIYYLRKECLKPEFEEDIERVHLLSAKFGTSYFINMLPKYMGDLATYMGCRTRMSDNWTGDWDTDCLRTGNLAYVTMNLPRIGYNARDESEVFDYIDDYMNIAKEILLLRRERALKCLNDYKILPFLSQEMNEDPYYRIENSSLTFGFVGLNEMLKAQCGAGITDPDADKFGYSVINYINDKTKDFKKEDGLRWGVIQTPAESTAYRFATMDREKYPDQVICNGDSSVSYYTNSSHVPVDANVSLPEKIKIESKYHPITQAGHIFHAFMGEAYSDPESLMSLTNKIAKKSDIGFWAYSSALSFCENCKTLMKGLQSECTHCGEKRNVEWYDRITGYVQQVGHAESASGGWNAGKKQELMDRKRF
jgi:ribonucleoside-triphosphate reductase